jgi:UDPglucose 6-dehydrogenase
MPKVEMAPDPYAMAEGCDAIIVVTDWNEFKHLDMERIRDSMKEATLIDGRNIYDPNQMDKSGFKYRGIGRGYNGVRINGQAEHEIIHGASSPSSDLRL